MTSLGEQLAKLNLDAGDLKAQEARIQQSSRTTPRLSKHKGNSPMLALPVIGAVSRIEAGRGFGFLIADGGREEIFFHIKGRAGPRDHQAQLPDVGARVLFMLGSDQRQGKSRIAAQWLPLSEISQLSASPSLTQAQLDSIRRAELAGLAWPRFWTLLRADWYRSRWNNDAPTDLADPVLEEVLKARIATLSPPELEGTALWGKLAQARYGFVAGWSAVTLDRAFDLTLFTLPQLLALGVPQRDWMRRAAPSLRAKLMEWHLHSRSAQDSPEDWSEWFAGTQEFEAALAGHVLASGLALDPFLEAWIGALADKGLLEGPGLDAWVADKPALALALFEKLSFDRRAELVAGWRTNPETLSAELSRVPTLLSWQALSIDLETDGERIWEVGCAQADAANLLYRESAGTTPTMALAQLVEKAGAAAVVVGHNLLAWDWPIICKATGTETIPLIWDTLLVQFLIEPQAASHALGGEHRADGDAQAALALFRRQLSLLPADFARRVLLGEFADAAQLLDAMARVLEGSAYHPRTAPEALLNKAEMGRLLVLPRDRIAAFDWVPDVVVAPAGSSVRLPSDLCEIDAALLERTLRESAPLSPAAAVVLGVARMTAAQRISLRRNMIPRWVTDGDQALAQALDRACITPRGGRFRIAEMPRDLAWWRDTDPNTYILAEPDNVIVLPDPASAHLGDPEGLLRDWSTTSLVRMANDGPVTHWIVPDRPADILEVAGGIDAFVTLTLELTEPQGAAMDFAALPVRPVLITRRHHVLHPHARDQAGYWQDVLRTCWEVSQHRAGATPILLIGSSQSPELVRMLEAGLAEVGLGEVRPSYRSRREHLSRAARKGFVVVDVLANWPQWQSIAGSVDLSLQPVVEALPLEQWYACAQRCVAETQALPHNVRTSEILEALPKLIPGHLSKWLHATGFAQRSVAPVLIDPRLSSVVRGLAEKVDVLALHEAPFSDADTARLDSVMSALRLEREEAPSGYAAMEQFLVKHWQGGSDAAPGFKDTQRGPMEAISARTSHVLVSLPTGEGKSVLFQVPALCRGLRNRRLTLVISPLKALMRDQAEGLRERGFAVSADYLNSDLRQYEVDEVMQGVLDHRIVLLYVAPERLRSPIFLKALEKRMKADGGLEHVVVDEAHCVNQWGYEFRPDYFHATHLLLERCRKCQASPEAEPTPFLLLSATITASDRERLEAFLSGVTGDAPRLPLLARPDTFANPIRSHIAIRPQRVPGAGSAGLAAALAARLPVILDAMAQARRNSEETKQRSAVIVFVQTRKLAETLADELAKQTGANVGFYHAGLDAGLREEVHADFSLGRLDVLVATKAFGMGMDIPHIHWVLHFSPSGYLEDYLQEVGRIGRGVAEREKAKLNLLSAVLPHSSADFDRIRDLRARNTLERHAVEDIYREVREHAQAEQEGLLSIVPAHGFKSTGSETERRAATTRMRMALYWLERAGKLRLCTSLPDVMTITLRPSLLETLRSEKGPIGELAGLLLGLVTPGQEGADQGRGSLTRLLEGLADRIGLGLSRSPGGGRFAAGNGVTSVAEIEAVINLTQIRFQSVTMKTNDDVLACLVDLEKRGAVSLRRDIEFQLRNLAKTLTAEEIAALFALVDTAAIAVLRQLNGTGRVSFEPLDLADLGPLAMQAPMPDGKQPAGAEMRKLEARNRDIEAAYISGLRTVLRACDVKLQQIVMPDETVPWEATLAVSDNVNAMARRKALIAGAQSLFAVVRTLQDKIAVAEVIDRVRAANAHKRFSHIALKQTAGLLSALKLVSMSAELREFSHVVLLRDEGETDEEAVWRELTEINDLAEARNLAMEVFANLRPDAQDSFIRGYFEKPDAGQLKDFLETQLGEIEPEESEQGTGGQTGSRIAQMQEQLRATKAVELFDRFRQSEEPAQWQAVSHPFDQHLLVNAGPGAGKTFVLVGRIAHLIREQRIQPSQIVVLAFNRAVVFEIRRRIRELFKSLGYAAHASRVRVSTIHSFALRHLGRDGGDQSETDMKTVLPTFARRMEADEAFRRTVAGDVRCILVDEFQDVTEDIYTVLRNLHRGSEGRAGVMVIGDDDQDILRWNRPDGAFSEKYFDRFVTDFGGETLTQLLLAVNFRSAGQIVDRSQKMIAAFFAENERSRRRKTTLLTASQAAPEAVSVERVDWNGQSFEEAVAQVPAIWQQSEARGGETLAILCRSNAEVAQAHRLLEPHIPGIRVQGTANLRTATLRHHALWLEFLNRELEQRDATLTDDLKRQLIGAFRQTTKIPECSEGTPNRIDGIEALWDLCCQEREFPHISTLIRFIEGMHGDDLIRLSGNTAGSPSVTVSTIHKVKGLEFDNVVVLPSVTPFGMAGNREAPDLVGASAEEARLVYVAMTRAKRGLWYFMGDREACWARRRPVPFAGLPMQGLVLEGSPEEVGLGWAMSASAFNSDPAQCQAYIEREVRVGDRIELGGSGMGAGKGLMHRSPSGELRQIGFVARKFGTGSRDADLKVSGVIRFHPQEPGEAATASDSVNWGYAVLIAGRLR